MNIAPNLKDMLVDIDSVQEYPTNSREGDVGAIVESLKAHGQFRPILINSRSNEILAGNHTWKAAKSLGWDKIAVTYVDVDEEEAKRIVLIDNKTNDLASYNYQTLYEELSQLAETEKGLSGTGFDEEELDNIYKDIMNEKMILDVTSPFDNYINEINTGEPEFLGQSGTGETYYKLNYAVDKEQREIIMNAIKLAKQIFETENSIEALVSLCGEWKGDRS